MSRRYYFVIESIIGIAALSFFSFLLSQDNGAFVGVSPHPFWIVVLLIASRYGTIPGLTAGVLAALTYVVAGSASGLLNLSQDSFPHGPYILPFLFLFVGAVIGEVRNIYKKKHLKLIHKYEETSSELQDLEMQHEALNESKRELDKRVAFQSTTMLKLFEQLSKMEILEPESLFARIPTLLQELLNVEGSSVYLLEDDSLKLHTRNGETGERSLPSRVGLTEGMIGEVIATNKVVAINQMVSEADVRRFDRLDMIMCAPIVKKDQSLVGVINIEKISFFDFNANTVKVFEMFAHWLSIVLDEALKFQDLKDKNIADEITGAYNYLYFQKRLGYEISRSKRFKSPLSLLLLEINRFHELDAAEKKNVLVLLNWIFGHLLRDIDIISRYNEESIFAIILPGQSNVEADIIISRLRKEINNYKLRPFKEKDKALTLKFGLSTLQLSDGSVATMIEAADSRLRRGVMHEQPDTFGDLNYLINKSDASAVGRETDPALSDSAEDSDAIDA